MINIETLNKSQLKNYINSTEFGRDKFIPISIHRAISHINNPRASEKDILLLLAYENSKLVGYLGVLPDYIFFNNKYQKIGWLSCIYIDANQRGKKIAQKLVVKSLEVWDNNILLTEFTAPAKRLYDKIGEFLEIPSLKGIRLYMRSDLQSILPPKHTLFAKTKPLLKLFDNFFNLIFDIRYLFYNKRIGELKLEYIDKIDPETEEFIKEKQTSELFKRSKSELNWLLSYPWVITKKDDKCLSEKYHFSSIDKSFEFISVKIKNMEGKLTAFIIFAKRNDNLKMPYCYYENIEDVVSTINIHLVKWKIKTASLYNDAISTTIKNSISPALFKKQISRNYLISKKFKDKIINSEPIIQDGDGDAAFT